MVVGKRKCKSCGDYVREFIVTPKGVFCSFEVASKFAYKNKSKGTEIRHAAEKKDYNANKLSTRKRATREACHLYIRTRDKDKPCPCCGEPLGDDFHAGHFWESGNFPFLRYHEDNIHGQKASCNTFKGGDSGFYRQNLIERIGSEKVEYLDNNRSNKVKLTADDYRAIEAYYKLKLKELSC